MLVRAMLSAFHGNGGHDPIQHGGDGRPRPLSQHRAGAGGQQKMLDLSHHMVYAAATVGGWVLTGVAGG
jgi:hypothetical protein